MIYIVSLNALTDNLGLTNSIYTQNMLAFDAIDYY